MIAFMPAFALQSATLIPIRKVTPRPVGPFASTRPNHWRVDLYALARMRLQQAGVQPGAIHGGGLSTIGEPGRFFSHRRDARTGRMATLAWFD